MAVAIFMYRKVGDKDWQECSFPRYAALGLDPDYETKIMYTNDD